MKRILVILVTYKPEEEILKRNIEAFIDFVDKILIWENTPLEEARKYRYVEHSKIEYEEMAKIPDCRYHSIML